MQARQDQKDVLEDHPSGVLQPAPVALQLDAVDRQRPHITPHQMVHRRDCCSGDEHSPVAVERQERQRSKHVEVSLDAPLREMNQQARHQQLGDAYDLSREALARMRPRQPNRKADNQRAQHHRRPDMRMQLTLMPGPGERRNPQRRRDARHKLKRQQAGKHLIGPPILLRALLQRELPSTLTGKGLGVRKERYKVHQNIHWVGSDTIDRPEAVSVQI